jgi:GNAT superfamily N-acetyltransferase
VREAGPDDAGAIAALLGELGYPADPSAVTDRLARMGSADAVLLADGGLVALHRIPLLAEGGAVARITALVVAPSRRRAGVGRALLAAAEEVARSWGCWRAEVSSGRRPERDAAHAFYLAAGFEETTARSTRYWKELSPPPSAPSSPPRAPARPPA